MFQVAPSVVNINLGKTVQKVDFLIKFYSQLHLTTLCKQMIINTGYRYKRYILKNKVKHTFYTVFNDTLSELQKPHIYHILLPIISEALI